MHYILILLILYLPLYVTAQEADVFARCFMLENPIKVPENAVKLIKPDGFRKVPEQVENILSINPDYMPLDALSEESRVLYIPTVVLESDSKDCVFLYPSVDLSFSLNYNPAKIELQAIAEDENLNVDSLIEKIALEDMSKYSNADTAFVYNLELKQPYLGRYRHCTGVVLKKYAHPGMAMKIITSDEGRGKLDQYMRKLFDSVLYDDEITATGTEAEKSAEEIRKSLEANGPCIHIRQAREKNKVRNGEEKASGE